MFDLRPYQEDSENAVRAAFMASVRAVLLASPTGSGKTVTFSSVARGASARGNPVLIIAHRDALIKQASRKLSDYGVDHGIIMAGYTPRPHCPVQVASVQTLVRRIRKRPDLFQHFKLIIIDECLHGDSTIETELGEIRIADVPRLKPSLVRSFDGQRVLWKRIAGFASKGIRKTVLVRHERGEIICTGNHLFFTEAGWKRADQLTQSDRVFVHAGAAKQHQSTVTGTSANGFLGTGSIDAKKLTGRRANGGTSQSSLDTNWSRVVGISEDSSFEVFDIEVEDTHCFFANGVLVHNCHLSLAPTYREVVDAMPNAKILGVTGTPSRLDGKGLGTHAGGYYDQLIVATTVRELIDDGYLVQPVVYAPLEQLDLSSVKKVRGDYHEGQLAEAVDKPTITGSAVEHYQRICPGQPAVAWCVNIKHATHVAEELNANGIRSIVLHGDHTGEERDRAMHQLSSGEIQVVGFCQLLVEGVDCPPMAATLMLRPTYSLTSYLQVIGRILRPVYAPGFDLSTREGRLAAIAASQKPRAYVLDHAGLTFRHGLADEDREWSLDGVVKKKKTKKATTADAIKISQCPECFHVFMTAPSCPKCGHVMPARERKVEHVDGELKEITPEMAAEMRKDRRIQIARAKTREELEELAKKFGYADGWVDIKWGHKKKAMDRMKHRRDEEWDARIAAYQHQF